jgi:hypothetical protein
MEVDIDVVLKKLSEIFPYNSTYPYTTDALEKNPYLGWQPVFPSPKETFSWRTCFSIQPTAPVSKLPQECREHPNIFGKAPVVDENWIPDVTMVRKMLMYGKDRDGNAFPPPLDKEFCEDIPVMGYKGEPDPNKECLKETNMKPTGPLNATTVTIDPSNHFGVDEALGLKVTVNAPTVMCLVYTMADAHSSRIQGKHQLLDRSMSRIYASHHSSISLFKACAKHGQEDVTVS